MWLPKDERHLLAGYYTNIGETGTKRVYRVGALSRLFQCRKYGLRIPEYGDADEATDVSCDFESMKAETAERVNRFETTAVRN